MKPAPRLHVRVPASTSNLGSGFDFLGLAFGIFLDATAERASNRRGGEHRVAYGAGTASGSASLEVAPPWTPDEDLVLRSLRGFEAETERALPALDVRVDSEIPVGRGFGSSGAAIAASLLLANGAASKPLGSDALISLAVRLDGHPDNATASLLGGCTAAVPTPDEPGAEITVIQPAVHESLSIAVAWPDQPLYTPEARAALPTEVPLADAIRNPQRIALLLEGLRKADARLLRLGVADRLHERFRRALVPGADAAIQAAYAAGAYAACLSGAGSGVVALGELDVMEGVANAMDAELQGGEGRSVAICRSAASVAQHP